MGINNQLKKRYQGIYLQVVKFQIQSHIDICWIYQVDKKIVYPSHQTSFTTIFMLGVASRRYEGSSTLYLSVNGIEEGKRFAVKYPYTHKT